MSLDLDFAPVFASSNALLAGTVVTIEITLCALVLSCILGLIIGVARINPQRKVVYGIASAYVAVIRGTPLLVQLFIWYYGLPRVGVMLPSFFVA
ncbi:ABC transporter permease subunit [Mangrovibacter sp. SLW1]